jgi:heptosyltransferase III
LKNTKKILIIIQRSNGDVFLSISLINNLFEFYQSPKIDLLVNDDTYALAKLLPNINYIHQFSYLKKKNNRLMQEFNLAMSLFKKYDLSINLTASDRSVIYALLAGRVSISAIENDNRKSWWKKKLLNYHYYFDTSKHILLNNLEPLKILKIKYEKLQQSMNFSNNEYSEIQIKLKYKGIDRFIIFHPSAQYNYKVYPKELRDKLLNFLNSLKVPIIITGGSSKIDLSIKNEIPSLSNIYNFIGETTLKDYLILSKLSLAYIGMDTLNMHIAASQNKRIFAVFGPSNIKMWSPWSNILKMSTQTNLSIQTYGNITIFQSSLPCEVCGVIGCGNHHDRNQFPYAIKPDEIFNEVELWYKSEAE